MGLVDTDGVEIVHVCCERKDHFLRINTNLTMEVKEIMLYFLKSNMDVFSWKPKDMPGIDLRIITYKLNVEPKARPVQHKKRNSQGKRMRGSRLGWPHLKKQRLLERYIIQHGCLILCW